MPHRLIASPLQALEQLIISAFADIETWLRGEYAKTPPPFYCSVDLRNSGHKIAAVDTNLFPGGFNNLSPTNHPLAAEAIRHQIDLRHPGAAALLLIPENHTRNLPYLDSVAVLRRLIEMAGLPVRIGRLDGQAQTLASADGAALDMHAIEKDADGYLHCGGFRPDAALLNNDLAAGLPPLLRQTRTPVTPPPALGWTTRKKSHHFAHYSRAAEQFAQLLKIDPWLLSADCHVCSQIDFHRREGMECLAAAIDETLQQIREKYRLHGIADDPYVVVKTNTGTYGMGVMMVRDASAVFSLNRKQRNHMAVGKEGAKVHDILIQEGVATADFLEGSAAEPVVYMVGGAAIGGFYRLNARRGSSDNLNSSGMSFLPLPFETNCAPPLEDPENRTAARLYVYSVIGRLANLAAAREIADAGGSDSGD